MTRTRLFTLGLLFTLLVTACSQGLRSETLTPQFGEPTPGDDYANDIAANAGGVYLDGVWNDRRSLIKFSRSGRIPWVKRLPVTPYSSLASGPEGGVYLFYAVEEGADETLEYFIRRYDQAGALVWTRQLTGETLTGDTAAATDARGNLYVGISFGEDGVTRTELRKYAPAGTLTWRKQVAEYVSDLDVSANGFLHTLSTARRLTRYKPDGSLLWRITVPERSSKVAVGREYDIFVASNPEVTPFNNVTSLAKYNSRGTKVWERTVREDFILDLDGLDADDQGNAFLGLSDPPDPKPSDSPKEFYAYSPGGERLASQVFDFGTDQPLVGPAAGAEGEVYLTTVDLNTYPAAGRLLRLVGTTGEVVWEK